MGRSRLIKDKWQIVETAFNLIEAEGLDNLSARKLAKNLGISTMTLYNYVPNMAAIEKEVVLMGFNKLYRRILGEVEKRRGELGENGIRSFCRISAWEKIEFAENYSEIYTLMFDPKRSGLKKDLELMPFYNYYNKISMVLNADDKRRESISKSISLFDYIINGIIIERSKEREKTCKEETNKLIDYALECLF
ncbi:MAG TPA: TetR/AcrR family transcriptional regulator [Clostridia bacterium]|nr:TetR/AcrR family transcriptional regulator [Clostridia bacterium]